METEVFNRLFFRMMSHQEAYRRLVGHTYTLQRPRTAKLNKREGIVSLFKSW